jgi:phosphate-selective porin OprO and OprP
VLHTLTLGVNWYLNPNAKFQVNYDLTRRGDTNTPADGVIQALGVRMAYDF